MKRCTKCGEEKDLGCFYKHIRMKDGLTPECKECRKAYNREYRERNREKYREWMREGSRRYRERHPERTRAATRKWREENREEYLAMKKRWREANPDRVVANWNAWYEANREKVAERAKANYDPVKKRESRSAKQIRLDRERRRARLLDAYVADVDFDEILIRDAGYCGICGEPIMEVTIELDHILPLVAGGTHEPDNCQVAHRSCNRRKHSKADFSL